MTLLLLFSSSGSTAITGSLNVSEAPDTLVATGTVGTVSTLSALVLDLVASQDTGLSSIDNITADTSPDLDITFPDGSLTGDVFKIYDGGTLLGTHTMTSGEVSARAFTMSLTALPNGTHPITATLTRGSSTSPTSSPLSITITPSPP